jgi:SAM-dependent methyltransferase
MTQRCDDLVIDLGTAPPSNAFLRAEDLARDERYWPLKVYACPTCGLAQLSESRAHETLFTDDYVYFSSYSRSWVDHARNFVTHAIERLALERSSLVLEVASNDGYLLQFVRDRGIRCLGVEPTLSTARAARARGIETMSAFFGRDSAQSVLKQYGHADFVIANNVLAHVPDLHDFIAGFATVLAPEGSACFEFPHLLEMVQKRQFDTIYHEHYSYLSLNTVVHALDAHGLKVWDVERIPTHGGSLRVWAAHQNASHTIKRSVAALRSIETAAGVGTPAFYTGFQQDAERIKNDLVQFLIEKRKNRRLVVGYGAAAKGNTLLNYAGIRSDLLYAVVDLSPHKQGRFLPGSRIPVVSEDDLREAQPDFVLILPWNLRDEIMQQLAYIREWGGQFVTAIPALKVF